MSPEAIALWITVLSGAIVSAVLLWLKQVQPRLDKRRLRRLREEWEARERYLLSEQEAQSREAIREREEEKQRQAKAAQLHRQQQSLFKSMSSQLEDLWSKLQEQGGKYLQSTTDHARCQAEVKALQEQIVQLLARVNDLEREREGTP